jgi:hypothetical protein
VRIDAEDKGKREAAGNEYEKLQGDAEPLVEDSLSVPVSK